MVNKIRVSTSTNLCNHVLWDQEIYTSEDGIRAVKEAGFESVDLDFAFWRLKEDKLAGDNWKAWAENQKAVCDEVGIPVMQAHAHFYGLDHCELLSDEDRQHRDNAILRDIEAAAICDVKWLVIHPESYSDDMWYSRKLSMEKNLELFKRYGEKAAKYGVGLAIENMFIHSIPCFAAAADDLVELVDRLGDDKVFGLCWDTGHGNLNKVDQVAALQMMGKRLKALHINDNKGQRDDHVLPFHGTIQWIPFMKALGQIGYEGDFTYEIHNFSKGFDAGFHHQAMRFAKEVADYMVSLM